MKPTPKISEQVLHLAININAGIEPIGWVPGYDGTPDAPYHLPKPNPKAAFKEANQHEVAWGYYYDPISFDVIRNRQLSRKEFKKEYSSYRLYISQCNPETYENAKHHRNLKN